jgi:hypothetical protein
MITKKFNILDDISTLSTIPYTTLTKTSKLAAYCICNAVEEASYSEEGAVVYANIGIGTLAIQVLDEKVKYQFIPSKLLSKGVADTLIDGKNPLTSEIESTVGEQFAYKYKDLL